MHRRLEVSDKGNCRAGAPQDYVHGHLARASEALEARDSERALAEAEAALGLMPAYLPALKAKAAALLQKGDAEAASSLLAQLLSESPDDVDLLSRLGAALRASGAPDEADAVYARVTTLDPGRKPAWIARIVHATQARDVESALCLCDEAGEHFPGDTELARRRAELLRRLGRTEEAVAAFDALMALDPGDPNAILDLAEGRLAAGQADKAISGFRGVLNDEPGNVRAVCGLAEALETIGDGAKALVLLEEACLADEPPVAPEHRPVIAMAYSELASRVSRTERIEEAMALAAQGIDTLNSAALVRLANLAQSRRADDIFARAIARMAKLDPLPLPAAVLLFKTADRIGRRALAKSVGDMIAARIVERDRLRFLNTRALLLDGPGAAFKELRTSTGPSRSAEEARLVAEAMIEAGSSQLAYRYLRACCRQWPDTMRIGRVFVRACILTGREDEALAAVDRLEMRHRASLSHMRYGVLLEAGRKHDAAELASEMAGTEGPQPEPMQMMRMALSLGQLEEAEAQIPALVSANGPGPQSATAFRTTQLGQMINEMKIHAHFGDTAPDGDIDNFFYPAMRVVEEHLASASVPAVPPSDAPRTIPRRVLQYWDRPKAPEEVEMLMDSWWDAPAYDYERFAKARAKAFLRDEFGDDHVRAFRIANNIAEQCDLLRLCLLYRMGGVYADADDRLTGDLDALTRSETGLVLFVEPMGAISNNVICAAPEHPVIGLALEKALASILARENDSTWAKTGPGLITRVAARHIVDARESGEPVRICLRKRSDLRRHVHPHVKLSYKSSASYWNATRDDTPRVLRETLEQLSEG